MNKAKYILAFALGAVSGIAATYTYFKSKYKKQTEEDIESVREAYNHRRIKTEARMSELQEALDKAKTYIAKEKQKTKTASVYQISGKEWDDKSLRHEKIELTYYADGVVTDEDGDVIPDPSVFIGDDIDDIFKSAKKDTVYIRNLVRECDYEILRDKRKWKDVDARSPHMTWRNHEKLE